MQKLTGLDEMFLSVDAARTTNGAMGGLVVLERPETPGAAGAAAITTRIEERLDRLPFLRWTLAKVPFGLDHARWVDSGSVEVADHVRTVTLEGAGDDRELAAKVAEIMATPLPIGRPLWELVVIEGLAGGRLAHLIRIHHGLIDGSSVPTVLDVLSDVPDPDLGFAAVHEHTADRFTGRVGMLSRGLAATAARPARFAALQAKTASWLVARIPDDGLVAGPAFAGRLLPGPLGAPFRKVANIRRGHRPEVKSLVPTLRKPATPINGRIGAERSYAFSDLPLADFKRVGKAYGVTLNDVVIAVVAGSLRRYLAERGGVPEKPMVVCIPASMRTGEEDPYWANHVSMFFAELPTDLEDPVSRLYAAHQRTKQGKDTFDALPTHLIREASEFIPNAMWTLPQRLLAKAPDQVPASQWNVVVSNVRGPSQPMSIDGARITGYWPAAFLTVGVGLNITLQSYVDRVDFGFMGATNLTGDLWEMPDHMVAELALLVESAEALEAEKAAHAADGTTATVTPIIS